MKLQLRRNALFEDLCFPVLSVRIRGVGTAALNMCLVAAGAADAYYEMGIHCWDVAGAGIIVTEAGGVLLDVTGETAEQEGFVFFPYLWDCTPNMAFFFLDVSLNVSLYYFFPCLHFSSSGNTNHVIFCRIKIADIGRQRQK